MSSFPPSSLSLVFELSFNIWFKRGSSRVLLEFPKILIFSCETDFHEKTGWVFYHQRMELRLGVWRLRKLMMMMNDARKRTHTLLQTATIQECINNAQWLYQTILIAAWVGGSIYLMIAVIWLTIGKYRTSIVGTRIGTRTGSSRQP